LSRGVVTPVTIQSEYALQLILVLFSELLSQLAHSGFTSTYRDAFCFCEVKIIDHPVLRYWDTGEPPFEEWPEKWLHDGEV
jgi:hypothetical protein